jgi:hypothetical protein
MKEQDGRLGRPLEVVDEEHDRRVLGKRVQPAADGVEQSIALGVLVAGQRLGEARDLLPQFRADTAQLSTQPAEDSPERLAL